MSEASPDVAAERDPSTFNYRLVGLSGNVVFAADKLEDVESYCSALPDGLYQIHKVLRRVRIETPVPKARIAFEATATRAPRKPRAPRAPRQPTTKAKA